MNLTDQDVARFWLHVEDEDDADACWLWQGPISTEGYGVFNFQQGEGGKRYTTRILAHRLAWELTEGELGPSATLDHVCHTVDPFCLGGSTCVHRRCVRPEHLEAVSGVVNTQRMWGRGLHPQQRKTRCSRGHAYAGKNLILMKKGDAIHRDCRECRNMRARANGRRYYDRVLRVTSKTCRDCGVDFNPQGSSRVRCNQCHVPILIERRDGQRNRLCPACGSELAKSQRFCNDECAYLNRLSPADRELYLSAS